MIKINQNLDSKHKLWAKHPEHTTYIIYMQYYLSTRANTYMHIC